MGKLYIQTWGCQMNSYDSARMADMLAASHGLVPTDRPEEADVLLLNTCSVREKAQEKVFSQLGRWREWKQARPDLLIGVGGCVASQEGESLLRRAPYVDLVFGPQTIHRLPEMIDAVRQGSAARVDVSFPEIEKFDRLPEPQAKGPVAFVSIMEGCSKFCSFCVVPYTRGQEVSRPFDDVLAECLALTDQGVREITLLGQNVNAYRGAMGGGETADLSVLIRYLAEIDGIARIRFTTSHPLEFSDRLIEAYAEVDKLADYLHLPVQSGSDRILAAMKRGYTVLEYKARLRRLREVRPNISLSTDFIVGFPGETEADFAASLRLIDAVGFDQAFSFIYSARPGTPAAALPDETPLAEKEERLARLQAAIQAHGRRYCEELLGTTQQVLVEGPSVKNPLELTGRIDCNRWVNFAGPKDWVGRMIPVRIAALKSNSLRGEAIAAEATAHA